MQAKKQPKDASNGVGEILPDTVHPTGDQGEEEEARRERMRELGRRGGIAAAKRRRERAESGKGSGQETLGEEGGEPDYGLLARDALVAVLADSSTPHASLVAAARALGERATAKAGGERTLDAPTVRRLVRWAGKRIPAELLPLEDGDAHEQMTLG